MILAVVLILFIAGTDQLIKAQIVSHFALYEEKPFLQIGTLDVMHLHFIENDGSAFSSFSGQRVLLVAVSVIGILCCGYVLLRHGKEHKLLYASLVMILGGAAGNLVDRLFRGGRVVDYLDLQLFDFAIFNFADCFVTIGTACLMLYILFFMNEGEEAGNAGNPDNSGNAGNPDNSKNSGNSGNTGNPDNSGNSKNSGNPDNSRNSGNSGNAGNPDNFGNAGNAGNAGNPDNSKNFGNPECPECRRNQNDGI